MSIHEAKGQSWALKAGAEQGVVGKQEVLREGGQSRECLRGAELRVLGEGHKAQGLGAGGVD